MQIGMQTKKAIIKSCAGCRYDSKRFLCLHPDEHKPEFWYIDRVINGRPWCYEAEKGGD